MPMPTLAPVERPWWWERGVDEGSLRAPRVGEEPAFCVRGAAETVMKVVRTSVASLVDAERDEDALDEPDAPDEWDAPDEAAEPEADNPDAEADPVTEAEEPEPVVDGYATS